MTAASAANARQIYNVAQWSDGYFDIDDDGHLVVQPRHDASSRLPLAELVEEIRAHGLALPVLVRFTDILYDRVDRLLDAFARAKKQFDYHGQYTAIYPIKVNQQRSVVEKLLSHQSGKVGLEAGSKPELLAILGVSESPLTIVCNGYKDREFLRLALIGQRMGHTVNIVVEKLSELTKLLEEADALGVEPSIGIRIRLNSTGKGKWQNTGGEKGKFGLSCHQVLEAVKLLTSLGKLQCLKLVHFHIGSQVANIRDIQGALKECARHYAELRRVGAPITTVDVGGGLGVDYEGSASRTSCSVNYSMEEYATRVVQALADICKAEDLPHPQIITESGRAMTAHHAVLIANVIDIERAPTDAVVPQVAADAPTALRELSNSLNHLQERTAIEAYHNGIYALQEAASLYTHGVLSIEDWATAELLYFALLQRVRRVLNPSYRAHREVLDELNEKLADKLFLNFSLFQSLPDVWGIDQIFPVVPLARLTEALTDRAIMQDITCDSDGQIPSYVDGAGVENSLPVPAYREEDEYLIGIFMVGAYQEILGDMHNLFGDTDSVHVEWAGDRYQVTRVMKGDTAADVLDYVHFEPKRLVESYRRQLAKAISDRRQAQALLTELEAGIGGYTYFED